MFNQKEISHRYYIKNKIEILQKAKLYYLKNKEKIIQRNTKYNSLHKKRIKIYNNKYNFNYYKKNKIRLNKQRNKYFKIRRKIDINFNLLCKLRIRLSMALKGKIKVSTTMKLVGCSIERLKQHLERQFKKDMTWKNYGKWHIDHIRPCDKFDLSKPEEQRKCFHYTNLQPLWAGENLRKNKY